MLSMLRRRVSKYSEEASPSKLRGEWKIKDKIPTGAEETRNAKFFWKPGRQVGKSGGEENVIRGTAVG